MNPMGPSCDVNELYARINNANLRLFIQPESNQVESITSGTSDDSSTNMHKLQNSLTELSLKKDYPAIFKDSFSKPDKQ